jgi:hypothetical protein
MTTRFARGLEDCGCAYVDPHATRASGARSARSAANATAATPLLAGRMHRSRRRRASDCRAALLERATEFMHPTPVRFGGVSTHDSACN